MADLQAHKNVQETGFPSPSFQKIAELWHQAAHEGGQPAPVIEQWTKEISIWAGLEEWTERFIQDVRSRVHLWFPGADEAHLRLLLALTDLADALGCSAPELVQALLVRTSDMLPTGPSEKPVISSPPDYEPLIEAIFRWQAIFELALDQAAAQLDQEHFPAEDLRASLGEMCDLLRAVLSRSST
jgi:hypothetical protein